jgi:hypothetical protein
MGACTAFVSLRGSSRGLQYGIQRRVRNWLRTKSSGKRSPRRDKIPLKSGNIFQITGFDFTQGGQAMVQLVEALRYKPEYRGFDSRRSHWNFSLTYSLRPHYVPGVDSASNRNEYQGYFLGGKGGRCLRLTTLPPSCADCLEIWEPQPPGTLRACPGL